MRKNETWLKSMLWLLLLAGLIGLALGPGLVQAGPTLPPRDPPGRGHQGDDDGDGGSDKPVGAYIELQTQLAAAGAWSVVQWQDSAGNWHDVEGWRGPLAEGNRRWWVAAKDFGTGPFRWALTQGPGGPQLSVSAPFNLPAQANQTLFVSVGPAH
ncbi:MAG: hypothetical protein L6R45_03905 [Anaerolineae bacterium]|nr:hypothetical protein [Anaerolineae bacterium]